MRQKTINIYRFEELDAQTKEKVIDHFRQNNDYDYLPDNMKDYTENHLGEHKIQVLDYDKFKVYYSLSYCQGDGAMFVGVFGWKGYMIWISHKGMYTHYNSKIINIETDEGTYPGDEIFDEFNEIYISICKMITKDGYDDIEFQNLETTIIETIDTNDYEFYCNGQIVSGNCNKL